MTIEELYKNYISELKNIYEGREAVIISEWVFEEIAGYKRSDLAANMALEPESSTIDKLNNALQQLLQHKPVQYVLGEAWFYKLKFFVNEHVLIPRPETEELVEWVVQESKIQNLSADRQDSKFKILDIGTGSGCIAIALKKEFPGAEIYGIDISEEALSVARKNSIDLNEQVDLLPVNILDESQWMHLPSVDVIVSNPPYIPVNQKKTLPKNVVEHEPHVALFVPENDPFIFYKKISAFAEDHLKPGGKIFVEVHENYFQEVQKIFKERFITERKKDVYGKERMIKAER